MANQKDEKYSIKSLLFSRSTPNYIATVTSEYASKLHTCVDCGDKFIMASSLLNHINRKSMKITYYCRSCNNNLRMVFFNRCNLLSHIRSHSLKIVTINVADLKVDPLPVSFFQTLKQKTQNRSKGTTTVTTNPKVICIECNSNIISTSSSRSRDRMCHYMQTTNRVHVCPICIYSLPTVCALKAHLRIHLQIPPFICPECGISLMANDISSTYLHACEGFNTMRATARVKCPVEDCNIYHPNDFNKHLIDDHMKKVFKCPSCDVACFSETTILKHILKTHIYLASSVIIFYQCQLCPGRLVVQNLLDRHLASHVAENVFPCWTCRVNFNDISTLFNHHIERHACNKETKEIYKTVRKSDSKKIYRVVKRCDQCKTSFEYKCKYSEINTLPNMCPYKCSSKHALKDSQKNSNSQIVCASCKIKINQDWEDIKKHYAICHKNYKCLDIRVPVVKMDIKKYLNKSKKRGCVSQKPNRKSKNVSIKQKVTKQTTENESVDERILTSQSTLCNICQYTSKDDEDFQSHIRQHRDPSLAYQCMECGQCFAVKPSFSTHLLMEHGISGVDEYVLKKQCYNDNALSIIQFHNNSESNLPLNKNQCKICREQFSNDEDLEKHFRVHGMAFLEKNQYKPNAS